MRIRETSTGRDRMGVRHREWGMILLIAYVVYQFTLAGMAVRAYPDFWYYQADSYRISVTTVWSHPMSRYQSVKHPISVGLEIILYRVGEMIFRDHFGEPLGENLALSFPVALFGAINVVIAWLILSTIGFRGKALIMVTVCYAASGSVWVFSSFPDSYACTMMLTNILLLAYLRDAKMERWWLLAALTALACYSAPQQMMLILIPAAALLRDRKNGELMKRSAGYFALVCVLFLIPYAAFMKYAGMGDFAVTETRRWASAANLLDIEWWLSVPVGMIALATAPMAHPEIFDGLTLKRVLSEPGAWLATILVIFYAVAGWPRKGRRWPLAQIANLIPFILAYLAFFIFWTPNEPFLYSPPILLVVWIVLHAGWVDYQDRFSWQAGMSAFGILVILSTFYLLYRSRDYDLNYERVRGQNQMRMERVEHGPESQTALSRLRR